MKPLKLFTLGALAAASIESQAAVIHTSLDPRIDLDVTIATVSDGALKFTVDFNNTFLNPIEFDNLRLAYIQFPTDILGDRFNTVASDEILVETLADGSEDVRGRTYFSLGQPTTWGYTDLNYFSPGETDVFFIEPVNETHSLNADTLFAPPVRLYFQYERSWDDTETYTFEVETDVQSAVPEPSAAMLAFLGLLPILNRKRK